MKPSRERTMIAESYPALLDMPPSEGLLATGLMIQRLKLEHDTEIAALRKLEHSYRTASRWQRIKGSKAPVTDINAMTTREFNRLRASMAND